MIINKVISKSGILLMPLITEINEKWSDYTGPISLEEDNAFVGAFYKDVNSPWLDNHVILLYRTSIIGSDIERRIRENKNYSYVVCETIECEDIDDIMLRVRWYIENNECVNIVIPLRTNEEYRQTEKYKNKTKIYREKHNEYQRVYRETHREQKKAYMKIYNKAYYQKHRERFLKKERNKKFNYVEPEESEQDTPPSSPRPPSVENTTFIKIKTKGSVILEF